MPRHWKVFAVAATSFFMVGLDTTMMNVAFDALVEDFPGTSQQFLAWVISGYVTVTAALLIPAGRLADLVGSRRVFLVGVATFCTGAALAGLAPGPGWLIGARVVEAVGGALVIPASLALLLAEFPVEQRGMAIGAWGGVGAFSSSLGPSLGGLIVDHLGWRWIFVFPLPLGLAITVAAVRLLPPDRPGQEPGRWPDPVGVLLSAAAIGLLALAIVQSDDWGIIDTRTAATVGLAVVIGAAFVWRTRHHPAPVLDPMLFRLRSFVMANLVILIFGVAFAGMVLANVLFLQRVWGYSAFGAGLGISPSPLSSTIAAPVGGRLADRFGARVVVLPAIATFLAGLLWLLFVVPDEPSYWTHWLPGALLFGTGIGGAFALLPAVAVRGVPPERYAVASATTQSSRLVAQVLGTALVLGVTAGAAGADVRDAFDRIYVTLVVVNAVALVVAFVGITDEPSVRERATASAA
jgi:EmrB/QacA subfamily drug resistance transporter